RKALVTAAAIGWSGQLAVFQFSKLATPCYHCLYPFEELDRAMKCSESSVMGPVVGMMGVYQALEALKVITDLGNSSHPELKL
ncbi:HesA/MoeB/ThiF family protein, partial [Vibrio alfacsensis]